MSRLSPVNQARWARFRHNRRGYWSLWIFLLLFGLSLCSELIANDTPATGALRQSAGISPVQKLQRKRLRRTIGDPG